MTQLNTSLLRDKGLLAQAATQSDDYAMFVMDPSGRVQSLNTGAEKILGYTADEIIGLSGDMIFTPEDLAQNVPDQERATSITMGRAEDERWHVRKDGSRFWGSGVLTALPGGIGYIKILRDLTERQTAQHALKASEERFRTLATSIPQLVFTSLENGSRTWGSPQWVIYTGLSDKESRDFGWLEAIHPDDRDRTTSMWREAMLSGMYLVEHRIRRAQNMEYRWHQTRATPLHIERPGPREWVGASTDIHDLRALKESQQVLLAELQHRTRNLLAMVQSIAERSAQGASSVPAFIADFRQRLSALSRAESITPSSDEGRIEVRNLVETELAAHLATIGKDARVTIEGPSASIPPQAAQPLMLALHELATNSVKYGALSQDTARLHVHWGTEGIRDRPEIVLHWEESAVNMPTPEERRRGYGTELIERALPYQLSAETKLEFGEEGVHCMVRVPTSTQHQV
ncbi:MAG: sensor histidine kinase [Povalibacter sp.]